MKDKVMGVMEKFAKAMVQPLMYLSAAGILIVVGVLLTNNTITNLLPFLKWAPIQMIGQTLYNAVMAIINNLSVVFVIGVPADSSEQGSLRFWASSAWTWACSAALSSAVLWDMCLTVPLKNVLRARCRYTPVPTSRTSAL